ncbi:hypothetical protein SKAU_G00190320 [Synaphobranchus kaupii]|uniref:G-protein coupled receptors family 1 profile domain-containing protein n=1 Tax=Synaphobranchus kaupii TaxID=118154 RepID=A0A9Q1FDB1_SYNKA|nr:hypothetical protein SKAU_G00190320 [Synaphobranchus kaupii]
MESKEEILIELITIRFLISIVGMIGNILLMASICKNANFKTFEVLLVGLALSNLESIFIVDIYDIILISASDRLSLSIWVCSTMKCLTVFGEVTTILFTMLISIFRYQKLRDAEKRVNLPILLDSVPLALGLSGLSVLLGFAFGMPTYAMNLDNHMPNYTQTSTCPLDFFQCPKDNCPVHNMAYKYCFLFLCILLPLCVVTGTSGLILRILLLQRRTVPAQDISSVPSSQVNRRTASFHRSTIAILAAMTIFQVDWIIYLALHLAVDPYTFPFWDQAEFLIATTYSTLSPYVYGTGVWKRGKRTESTRRRLQTTLDNVYGPCWTGKECCLKKQTGESEGLALRI